jgi:hypothetical protein
MRSETSFENGMSSCPMLRFGHDRSYFSDRLRDHLGVVRGGPTAVGHLGSVREVPRVDSSSRTNEGLEIMPELAQDLIGSVGRVTVPIEPGRAGEVILPVRGGSEAFAAHADEVIAKNARVVVVESLSPRSVIVTPCA